MRHDVTFPLYVEVDQIYNLACPASPVHYQFDPVQTTKTSVHGRDQHAGPGQAGAATILQASTSEVYGDPQVHPQPENYWGHVNPIGPRACYDEGKRCAETLFFDYHRQHGAEDQGGADLQHLRPAHASQRRPGGVQLHRPGADGPATSPSTATARQTRSFCYVDDLVEGLMRLMDTPRRGHRAGQPGQSGRVHACCELAEKVIDLTGSRSKLVFAPLPADDPMQRQPDISRARELLGWEPTIHLDQGLERTVDYFRWTMFPAA